MVNDLLDEALGKVKVNFGFLFHEHFHVTLMSLLALHLEELSKIRLGPPAHSLHFALCEGVQDRLCLSVHIVDQKVMVGLFDVLNGLFKYKRVGQIVLALGA